MKTRIINVFDPSVMISKVEKRHETTIKHGRVTRQQTIRTAKLVPLSFFVEIESKDGITHALERRRVHAAMIAKFGTEFPTLRRNSDGSYTIAQPTSTALVAILENGSRVSGENRERLAKRAAAIAIAQDSRVVEIVAVAA